MFEVCNTTVKIGACSRGQFLDKKLLVIPGVGAVAISAISYSGADVDRKRAEIEICGLKTLLGKSA